MNNLSPWIANICSREMTDFCLVKRACMGKAMQFLKDYTSSEKYEFEEEQCQCFGRNTNFMQSMDRL
jgi:septin family protein